MPSARVALAFALAAAAAKPTIAQETQAVPAFPTQAEAITADVVVLDKQGRPVPGLKKEDFTLLEDGKPQSIVGFEARDLGPPSKDAAAEGRLADDRVATNEGSSIRSGRTFALLVDDLGTQILPMEAVKKAIGRWLNETADARDSVTITTASGDVFWSDTVGRGRADLVAVLGRIQGKKGHESAREQLSDWEAYRISVYEDATDGAMDSAGGTGATGGTGPAGVATPVQTAVGHSLDRVIARWLAAGACPTTPDPATTRRTCSGTVRARAEQLYRAMTQRIQATLTAVERLSRGLAGVRGRKSILIFSEGFLNDTHQKGVDRAIDASQRGNTAVYFIDAKGLAGLSIYGADQMVAPSPGDVMAMTLEETQLETAGTEYVAENTGGASIRNSNDLLAGLERVADESATYYLLGYQPEKSPDGKWHKLEVKVNRPGVKVRARRGYQATPPPAPEAPRAASKKSDDKGKGPAKGPTRALDPAVMAGGTDDAIPLRIAPYVLEADATGLARVLVAVEIETARLGSGVSGEQRKTALDLTLLGVSRDQAKTFPVDERINLDLDGKAAGGWLNLTREIRLPAGVAQVRALVRDVATGRAGTVTERLVVPALDKPYLATPFLTDRVQVAKDGSRKGLVPVAHREFRPQGRLFCMYEVFGMTDAEGHATTQVAGGFGLQTAAGRLVASAPPTPISVALDGHVVRVLTLPLDGMEEGDYELVLDIVDHASGRTLQAREAFALRKDRVPAAGE